MTTKNNPPSAEASNLEAAKGAVKALKECKLLTDILIKNCLWKDSAIDTQTTIRAALTRCTDAGLTAREGK